MTATLALTTALQRHVLVLEEDLRTRVESSAEVAGRWHAEHNEALASGRTAATWQAWRDDRVTQAAVAWVLATVFVRFCEDNALVDPVWITGPDERRQEALDAELAFFRAHPEATHREWLEDAIAHLRRLPVTAGLVDSHAALHLVSPSGDAALALLAFWRERGEDGMLVHDLRDPALSTRFLGDLYQDLSKHARDTYALLQTPQFVVDFILDQTLEPALRERPLEGFRIIDPTCGSGHFLLSAFARLLDRWDRRAPALDAQARVQMALDAIHGVDLNPFAVAIARFRLVIAALQACGLRRLAEAPAFRLSLAVGDSLLHGTEQLHLEMRDASETDEALLGFAYATEDLELLRRILRPGSYDVVLGNPPYITVRDKSLNAAYRERYTSCKGTYALTVPFMERSFGLAAGGGSGRPAGWVGQITSNSFMKRQFGSKLIEDFLVRKDLRLVVDTSGAYIPGHGTPTVIIVGRNQRPVGNSVRAVLGVRGEPGRPKHPSEGVVWRAIVDHAAQPGWDDGWVTVADLDRTALGRHPWSLTGGAALVLEAAIGVASTERLADRDVVIGRTTHTGSDDCFYRPRAAFLTAGLVKEAVPVVLGENVRDYTLVTPNWTLFPYNSAGRNREPSEAFFKAVWPLRTVMAARVDYQQTLAERGLRWVDHSMFFPGRFAIPLSVAFAFVSTHNHFVLDRGGKVFKQSAPVIKLPVGASADDHLALLGVLNSSTACFWLKQKSHGKGNGGIGGGIADEKWEPFFEFTGTTLEGYPLPASLPLQRGRILDALAQELVRHSPSSVCAAGLPSRVRLDAAQFEQDRIRGQMVGLQEELDWEVYALYELAPDLTYAGPDLPRLDLGERAFEIALARRVAAGLEETAWFTRHGSQPVTDIPSEWPPAYAELVQRRLDLIAASPTIRLLEKPEYKRRWAAESWEKRETAALYDWLLDRLEDRRFWFDRQGRPAPRSIGQLADQVARDPDLVRVLSLWEGRPDVPLEQSLTRLVADEAVPYLAAFRYTGSGLRKREAWEQTWTLQRREDAGELIGPIPVPPQYAPADFRQTRSWQARGKLDVPKERFILYPGASRDTDPTPLLGWAGWDHAQQSLALNIVIEQREAEGWADEQLVPLVAGLAELQPWVDQWHGGVDATMGVDLSAFCQQLLASRAAQVGCTIPQLAEWRPDVASRGRRPRIIGATL